MVWILWLDMVVFNVFSDFISATEFSLTIFCKLSQFKTNHPRGVKPMPSNYLLLSQIIIRTKKHICILIHWWAIEEFVLAPVCKCQKGSYISISWAFHGCTRVSVLHCRHFRNCRDVVILSDLEQKLLWMIVAVTRPAHQSICQKQVTRVKRGEV